MHDIADPQELAKPEPFRETRVGSRGTRVRRALIGLVIVGVSAGGALFYFSHSSLTQQQRTQKFQRNANHPQSVAVATVSTQDIDVYLTGLGSVTPLNTVAVC